MSYGAGSRLSKGGTDAETPDCRVGNRGVFGWVLKFNKNRKGGTGNHWHGPVPQMSNQQVKAHPAVNGRPRAYRGKYHEQDGAKYQRHCRPVWHFPSNAMEMASEGIHS